MVTPFLQQFVVVAISLGLSVSGCCGATDYSAAASCPMSFEPLGKLVNGSSRPLTFIDIKDGCRYMKQGLRLVRAEYLRTTGYFFPPRNSSEACWDMYRRVAKWSLDGFNIWSACGFDTGLISNTCLNISTRSDFESLVPESELKNVSSSCRRSLADDSRCGSCLNSLESITDSWSSRLGRYNGNESDCGGYPSVYAAGVVNPRGVSDSRTVNCLFGLDFGSTAKKQRIHGLLFGAVVTGGVYVLFGAAAVIWLLRKRNRKKIAAEVESEEAVVVDGNLPLVRFTIDEIIKASNNFARENIIGKGGFGNVYKGVLPDGSEVALKRFKNCSTATDMIFAHEVEVVASVRHVNLVALRGYCTGTAPPLQYNQRIIVCDLIPNGSLHDHLFGSLSDQHLSWPIRWRIAVGTARGLEYLHNGVRPAIIHRDVKASNILLDKSFEPRLADFGLAKFTPDDGQSHMSTRVAGTMGYVAPEYALYGQLTEKSDVYSFGIVLLELLSGRNAVFSYDDGETILLADWAWEYVRDNRAVDVIDETITDLAVPEVMEKFVLLAVLCSHPLLHARPSMDQVVKILETDSPVPPVPDRPPSLLSKINRADNPSVEHPMPDSREEIEESSERSP